MRQRSTSRLNNGLRSRQRSRRRLQSNHMVRLRQRSRWWLRSNKRSSSNQKVRQRSRSNLRSIQMSRSMQRSRQMSRSRQISRMRQRLKSDLKCMFMLFNILLYSQIHIFLWTNFIFTDHLSIWLVNYRSFYSRLSNLLGAVILQLLAHINLS